MTSSELTPAAFLALATPHLPALLRVGVCLPRNRADAEDLGQDTLERALGLRQGLRDPSAVKGWLLAVQRTVLLNGRRGLRRHLEVIDGGQASRLHPPAGDLEQEILAQGLDDRLRGQLDSLPAEWRDALWLREVEELSYEEIATIQGCPIGTVRSRLARARMTMLRQLSEERAHGPLST